MIRPDLENLIPYAAPQLDVPYRMNTNESPYAPPAEVLDAIADGVGDLGLNRYPDRDARVLRSMLASRAGTTSDHVWAANGSNEVLLQLLLAFGGAGRSALVFEPTYPMHSIIARVAGTAVIDARRDTSFEIDLDEAVPAIKEHRPGVIFCCSPNNPTGHREPLGTIKALAEETDGLVIVDEAYREFDREESGAANLLLEHPNLVVVRTLSKAWRMAGARIGYALSSPHVISALAAVRLPYHLSSLTQLAATVALEKDGSAAEMLDRIIEQRDLITVELGAMGLKVWPSRANFVLFQIDGADAVWNRLLERGILIRSYAGHAQLTDCLRVTAGTPEETAVFLDAMREIVSDE